VSLGLTGTIEHVSGTTYEGTLSDPSALTLFLDPTSQHATFVAEFQLVCLQRGATALPAGGFVVPDVAPDSWIGTNPTIESGMGVTGTYDASATILADGSYSGSDSSGLVFGSPAGTMLAPDSGILVGPYEDNVTVSTTGMLEVLPSPDLQFVTVVAYPIQNSTTRNGQFIGAWSRD